MKKRSLDGVTMRALLVAAATGLGMAACGGGDDTDSAGLPATAVCEAATGILPHAFGIADLAGDYALTLVATSGDSAEQSTVGALVLLVQADSLRTMSTGAVEVAVPLYGTVDIDLGAVKAVEVGLLDSTDPMEPGVLALERHVTDGVELTLRFGSVSNRRNQQLLFDGGFTALSVHWARGDRFGGSWRSGEMGTLVEGYFCADRVAEEG